MYFSWSGISYCRGPVHFVRLMCVDAGDLLFQCMFLQPLLPQSGCLFPWQGAIPSWYSCTGWLFLLMAALASVVAALALLLQCFRAVQVELHGYVENWIRNRTWTFLANLFLSLQLCNYSIAWVFCLDPVPDNCEDSVAMRNLETAIFQYYMLCSLVNGELIGLFWPGGGGVGVCLIRHLPTE